MLRGAGRARAARIAAACWCARSASRRSCGTRSRGDPQSPLLNYETRCPCGVQYCRITPEGKVTPCPYTPAVAGDLRRRPRSARSGTRSPVFADAPHRRARRQVRPLRVPRDLRRLPRARVRGERRPAWAPTSRARTSPTGAVPLVERARARSPTARARATGHASGRLRRARASHAIPSFVRGVVTRARRALRARAGLRPRGRSR